MEKFQKNKILNDFGKNFIEAVRDESIKRLFKIIEGNVKAPKLLKLHKKLESLDEETINLLKELATECINNSLHNFLWFIEDSEKIDLLVKDLNNNNLYSLKEISDGLSGELYTQDGWIEKFSKYPPSIE